MLVLFGFRLNLFVRCTESRISDYLQIYREYIGERSIRPNGTVRVLCRLIGVTLHHITSPGIFIYSLAAESLALVLLFPRVVVGSLYIDTRITHSDGGTEFFRKLP